MSFSILKREKINLKLELESANNHFITLQLWKRE